MGDLFSRAPLGATPVEFLAIERFASKLEALKDETRDRRVAETIERLKAGKKPR
jgi:hypothetical protein